MPHRPCRAVVMGACGDSGRSLAAALGRKGAELLLADYAAEQLSGLSKVLAAKALYCDVASASSVQIFAAEIGRWGPIDILINAAGAGYERTLGMHRVSRALMPALRPGGGAKWIINVPPTQVETQSPIFAYASSEQAFARLSEAVAQEAHGSGINVGIACPAMKAITHAGSWSGTDPAPYPEGEDLTEFAERLAEILIPEAPRRAANQD